MNSNNDYPWDYHSDQPHVIRDKAMRRQLRRAGLGGAVSTLLVSLYYLPYFWIKTRTCKALQLPSKASNIGLGVNIESDLPEKQRLNNSEIRVLVGELDVNHILLRVPLEAADALKPYTDLAREFTGKKILIDVLQSRETIENEAKLNASLRKIFTAFLPYTTQFKIGNAINRRKWGFLSPNEYFVFFEMAQYVRDTEFKTIELMGGGIIDFELPSLVRNLVHRHKIRYDATAALLYVDRRGAPENTQLGANLIGKIGWFHSIIRHSKKTRNRLVITETNWPLKATEPFAPAVGDCMVDENQQARYLARYYLLAFATGKVEAIYWHQLVAPGYGLIDNRVESCAANQGLPRKRRAYYAFKTLVALFSGATVIRFEESDGLYVLLAEQANRQITAVWTNDSTQTFAIDTLHTLNASAMPGTISILSMTGETLAADQTSITLNGDVVYFVQQ